MTDLTELVKLLTAMVSLLTALVGLSKALKQGLLRYDVGCDANAARDRISNFVFVR
ncbi:hypothetical protein [Bifidobacterium adolescentis]|uniref:hypothetical protein n=1 Tax=Bifidobacterium adolescentis TaxID=1680 RepID=UPI0034A4388B